MKSAEFVRGLRSDSGLRLEQSLASSKEGWAGGFSLPKSFLCCAVCVCKIIARHLHGSADGLRDGHSAQSPH